MSDDPVVRIRQCSRRFNGLVAVDRLDLEVRRGEIFGLIGPDGAGKTTTLRMIAGLLDPTEGDLTVTGFPVATAVNQVKDHIGYMAQRFGMYGDLTVQENLHFFADLFGISDADRDQRMNRLLQMTRMEPFRARRAANLSGGMKQKLALMCSLLHQPELLILDEPTNGVDPVSRRDFWTILYQLVRDGLTVILATAYLDEAERCTRIGMLYRGRMVQEGTPEDLKRRANAEVWAVRGVNLHRARGLLASVAGLRSVEQSGAELHLIADPGAGVEALARPALEQGGLSDFELARILPSVEDVFIVEARRAEAARA